MAEEKVALDESTAKQGTASTAPKLNMKKHLYSAFEKRDFLFAYLLVLFPVAQFTLFWFYGNVSSFILAFQNGAGEFTFANMQAVFQNLFVMGEDGYVLFDSLVRTWITWGVGALICFPCSLVTVYVLTCKIRFHYFYRVCYILPGLIGSVIWASIVKMVVANDGPIITMLSDLGIELPYFVKKAGLLGDDNTAYATLIIIQVVMGVVGDSPVITGAFARVSDELYESADLDGAGFWTKCFKIGIPCIWSTITTLLVFRLCSIFTADCGVFLYTNGLGNHNTSTVGFQLFNMVLNISDGAPRSAYGYPSALGMVLTIFTLPVCLGGRWILEKINDSVAN